MNEDDHPYNALTRTIVAMVAALVLILLAAVVALGLLIGQAMAHSWYDRTCCDISDCSPLPPDAVQVTPQGYRLPNGQLVPFARARVSMDRDFHWCRRSSSSPLIEPYGEQACFYAPGSGS